MKTPIGLMNKRHSGANPMEAENPKTVNTPGNKEDKLSDTTPNRGNNNPRRSGNQIGMMRNGNTPNNPGNNQFKKSPWGRNTNMAGSNDSPSNMESPNDFNQPGSGNRRPMGQGRGRGRGRNFNTPDNGGNPSNQRSGRGFRGQGRDFHITEKLREISENMDDLVPKTETRRKFSNQARLWIGNIPLTTIEEDLKELFQPYGEFDEFYFDKNKGFGFVRMDYKDNALKAQVELNKKMFNGRELRIRLSPTPGTALKIRNLTPSVTTELLEKVFEVFGELERVVVFTDDRGNSKCEGVVEYCKKPCAQMALRICSEGCLYITASLRPVIVEQMPLVDDTEGLGEINVNKRETRYFDERQMGPRLPLPGSFEDEFGKRWKELYVSYDIKKKEIENILIEESHKLDMQMDLAKQEHETEMLRQKLREKEEANYYNKLQFEQQQRRSHGDDFGFSRQGDDFGGGSIFTKYEEELLRQKEDHTYLQNFSNPNQKRWEDSHYDSLYNEPLAQRDSFGGRQLEYQGSHANNRRSFDQQGGNNLRNELGGPMDRGNNSRGGIDPQGGKNLLDGLSKPVDNQENQGKDLRSLIPQGGNFQGQNRREFGGNNLLDGLSKPISRRSSELDQGMSDRQGGNNLSDDLSKPMDNQGDQGKDLRSLIHQGGNNQGNRRSFDQGMSDRQGGNNLSDDLSKPMDNQGKDLRSLIHPGGNNQGNRRSFDRQGMSDRPGGNNMSDDLSKPMDNQGKDLRSLIHPGGNNQGNRRSFDRPGMSDHDDNAPKRARF